MNAFGLSSATIDPRHVLDVRSTIQQADYPELGGAGPSSVSPSRRKKIMKATEYSSSQEMLDSLRNCFTSQKQVDFAGTCVVFDHPSIPDKHRVQLVASDIWNASGYRFTVKDHPPVKDGHKTRFWCAQDDARMHRRAKNLDSPIPETAKARYPCHSRLLISSCDSRPGHRVVTVRIHHFSADGHEPYQDVPPSLPPKPVVVTPPSRQSTSFWSKEPPIEFQLISAPLSCNTPQTVPQNGPVIHELPRATPEDRSVDAVFRERMHAHICNIRDFCDGLEYQLQFNDHRVLEELEREGAKFLGYVHSCLDREGRLRRLVESIPTPPPSSLQDSDAHVPPQGGSDSDLEYESDYARGHSAISMGF